MLRFGAYVVVVVVVVVDVVVCVRDGGDDDDFVVKGPMRVYAFTRDRSTVVVSRRMMTNDAITMRFAVVG